MIRENTGRLVHPLCAPPKVRVDIGRNNYQRGNYRRYRYRR